MTAAVTQVPAEGVILAKINPLTSASSENGGPSTPSPLVPLYVET
jgi:hypothetical protein